MGRRVANCRSAARIGVSLFAIALIFAPATTCRGQGPASVANSQVRMRVPEQPVAQVLPAPTPEMLARERNLISEVVEPDLVLDLKPNRSKLLRTKRPLVRTSIVDDKIVQVVQFNPNEVELIGVAPGETNLTLWFADAPNAGPADVLRYFVRVGADTSVEDRQKLEYTELQNMINEMFADSSIELLIVADKLVVRGQARDAEEASQIVSIIRGRAQGLGNLFNFPTVQQGPAAKPFPGGDRDLPLSNVVNMLRVPGEQQVLLKVRVAEIDRTALRQLGTSFSVNKKNFSLATSLGNTANITALLDNKDVDLMITALSSNTYTKTLAEPNLVTLSGRPASFIAGGEFAVPTTVGVAGVQAATTFFQGFGAQLLFIPTVLDKDRIRLQVAPTFSTINKTNSVNGIPGLDTRSVRTTVDMREGQWLAIAGLLQDQQNGTKSRIPFFGDLPVVGTLFSNKTVTREETELLILVSPQLVHPMEPEQAPRLLPGMETSEPNEWQFYGVGNIEGRPGCEFRSTVWPNQIDAVRRAAHEAKQQPNYRQTEQYYISTAHGFSD